MVKKSNNWNLQEMQESLVRDTENSITQGLVEITKNNQGSNVGYAAAPQQQKSEQKSEPTKGVQTYIPMSMYRRLNDIKLTRRENIAALVSQAIALWLDVQEGKSQVNKVI